MLRHPGGKPPNVPEDGAPTGAGVQHPAAPGPAEGSLPSAPAPKWQTTRPLVHGAKEGSNLSPVIQVAVGSRQSVLYTVPSVLVSNVFTGNKPRDRFVLYIPKVLGKFHHL